MAAIATQNVIGVTSSPISDIITSTTTSILQEDFSRNVTTTNEIEVPSIDDTKGLPVRTERVISTLEPYFQDERFNTIVSNMNISAPFLVVLLSSLVNGQTQKYPKTPHRTYSLSFADTPSTASPFNALSPNHFTTPKYPSTPKYPTTPRYPEFFGSTPAYISRFTPSATPLRGSTPPPIYRGHVSSFCDPHNPPACAANGTEYCLHDSYYPTYEVEIALKEDAHLQEKYASDVSEQSANDLVTHISANQEFNFDYSYYNPAKYDITHWIGPEGYLCPSEVIYGTPKRARNAKGEWRVIVNGVRYYTQTTRLETCMYPLTPCRMLAPCYKSKCLQKYSYQRFLSFDPCDPFRGLFVDVYKLPSACSCYVPTTKD